jgi:hypothetical protein
LFLSLCPVQETFSFNAFYWLALQTDLTLLFLISCFTLELSFCWQVIWTLSFLSGRFKFQTLQVRNYWNYLITMTFNY